MKKVLENIEYRKYLDDEQLVKRNRKIVYRLPSDILKINHNTGRTSEQLFKKAEILHDDIKYHYDDISLDECFSMVNFRVLGETWNGVIIRENNTVFNLSSIFGSDENLEFRKTEGDFDFEYAVDYELYMEDRLILGFK